MEAEDRGDVTSSTHTLPVDPTDDDWRVLRVRYKQARSRRPEMPEWSLVVQLAREHPDDTYQVAWSVTASAELTWLRNRDAYEPLTVTDDDVVADYAFTRGMPACEASPFLGVDESELRRKRALHGLRAEDGYPDENVSERDLEIRRVWDAGGVTQTALAKRVGLTQARVSQVIYGKR